jgi:hypothetical protein
LASDVSSPVKLVIAGDVKYSVHDTVFSRMFRKAFTPDAVGCFILADIPSSNFGLALGYMYTLDTGLFGWRDPSALRVLIDFAIKYSNMHMAAALMEKLDYNFKSEDFLTLFGVIYNADADAGSYEHFEQVIKEDAGARL